MTLFLVIDHINHDILATFFNFPQQNLLFLEKGSDDLF